MYGYGGVGAGPQLGGVSGQPLEDLAALQRSTLANLPQLVGSGAAQQTSKGVRTGIIIGMQKGLGLVEFRQFANILIFFCRMANINKRFFYYATHILRPLPPPSPPASGPRSLVNLLLSVTCFFEVDGADKKYSSKLHF